MAMMRYIVYPLVFIAVLLIGATYWLCTTPSGTAFLLESIDARVDTVSIGPVQGALSEKLYLETVSVSTETMEIRVDNSTLQIDLFALLALKVKLYELNIEGLAVKLSADNQDTDSSPGGAINIPVDIDLTNAFIKEFEFSTATFSRTVQDIHITGSVSDGTLAIRHFSASDEMFTLTADLNLALAPPWTLTSAYHATSDMLDDQALSLRGQLDGDIEEMNLEGVLDSPQRIQYTGQFALNETPRGTLTLSATQLDLNPLLAQPWQLSGPTLEVSGTLNRYEFTGQGDLVLPDIAPMTYGLNGSGDLESLDLMDASLHLDQASVVFSGNVAFAGDAGISGKIQAQDIPLSLAHEELEGTVGLQGLLAYEQESGITIDLDRIDGSIYDREINGQVRLTGKNLDDALADGQLRLGANELKITSGPEPGDLSFTLDAPELHAFRPSLEGRLTASGKANIGPPFRVNADIAGQGIPVSALDPTLTGHLDFDSQVTWNQAEGYSVDLTNLNGNVAEQTLSGNARVSGSSAVDLQGEGQLQVGDNHLHLSGDREQRTLTFEINAPTLGAMYPDIAGDLQAAGNIRLDPDKPIVQLQAESDHITFMDHRIDGLRVDIPEAPGQRRTATATWESWQYGDVSLGGLRVDYDGTLEAGELHLAWERSTATAEITMGLRRNNDNFEGQLRSGTISLTEQIWQADENITFAGSVSPADLKVASHCWRSDKSSVCFPVISVANDSATLHADLKQIPVEFMNIGETLQTTDLPANLGIKALVDLDLKVSRSAETMDSSFEARLPETRLSWSEDEDPLSMSFLMNGKILDNKLEMALETTEDSNHAIDSRLLIPDFTDYTKFDLELRLDGDYVPILTALAPALSDGKGHINANLRGNMTGSRPEITGEIRVPAGASVAVPAAGIRITDIELTATARNVNLVQFHGTGNSGDGSLTFNGDIKAPLSSDRVISLSLSGENFRAMNTKELMLVTSPDLKLQQSDGAMKIGGKVSLVDGDIRYGNLDTGGRSVSNDVTIDDAEPDRSVLARANVELELEVLNKVHIQGFGLDANIAGNLSLDQGPDSPPRAHGTLTLSNGTFARYGQTLSIDRGRLIYSGPLNNPTIDVVTSRSIRTANETVKVTLTLSGPANNIRSQITAEPTMSEANALSWLVLGRPLASASSEEGHNLAGTALSLGLKKALPIAREIGSTLGLDEFDVSADTADSASIIAGKRINQDLYIRYNYDVFSRIGGILFNYALTPHLSVEAQSGESKSLELIYTF